MGEKLIDRAELIEEAATLYDDLRSGDQVCFLIKRRAHSDDFESVLKLESGWFVSYDKFRESTLLRVATGEADFENLSAQSSYVAYGTPDADSQIDVYEISPDRRDRIPPNESSPVWKFYIERMPEERFLIMNN